jgi:hypothetical protein
MPKYNLSKKQRVEICENSILGNGVLLRNNKFYRMPDNFNKEWGASPIQVYEGAPVYPTFPINLFVFDHLSAEIEKTRKEHPDQWGRIFNFVNPVTGKNHCRMTKDTIVQRSNKYAALYEWDDFLTSKGFELQILWNDTRMILMKIQAI